MVPSEVLALSIVERLQAAGHVAYLAGGCVRDRLMGRGPKDYDVATSARPEQILALYPRAQQVGVSFGVVLVRGRKDPDGSFAQVEVATFRADGTYSDGRRPDSVRFTDAREDARRRDFTCNGLFFDPLAQGGAGELHDFVGGRADIEAKVLRAIGNPEARFAEDHLRMLRAIRFAGKLGFTIDPDTLAAIQRHAGQIKTVSKERVHDELANILEHASRASGMTLLERAGLLVELWPKPLYEDPEISRQFLCVAALPADADFIVALAAAHRDIGSDSRTSPSKPAPLAIPRSAVADYFREAFLLSNVETADLAWLLEQTTQLQGWEALTKAQLKRILADPRWPRLEKLFLANLMPPNFRERFSGRVTALQAEGAGPVPFIKGETLIKLGATPGPEFRQWLDELYDRQLEGELKTREEALAAAQKLIHDSA